MPDVPSVCCMHLPMVCSPCSAIVTPCSESVRPLEPMRNRPPQEPRYLEDEQPADSGQVGASLQSDVGAVSNEHAVILAEPPAARKLASVELVPSPQPVFRPVRTTSTSMEVLTCLRPIRVDTT